MTATIRTCTKNRAEVKKSMIKPDPCLSLSFYWVRVFQKHCSLVFVCICRLKSCSPPCLLSALEEIVFSRLLEKLTVSSLSQLPITNFLYLNLIIGDIDHVVLVLYWINLNSARRVRRALLQFRDWTRWRCKRLRIFLLLAMNFEMLDFFILINYFFFLWRLLRKQLCGKKSIWMKNLTVMKKLSTKLKYLQIGMLLFNIQQRTFSIHIYIYICIYMVFCSFGKNQVKVALYYLLIEN